MRIAILDPGYTREAQRPDYDVVAGLRPYIREHDCTLFVLDLERCREQVREAVDQGFDIYLNLCDGAPGQGWPGVEVVEELERLGVPFTGAGSGFYAVTRRQMKRACQRAGIATPPGVHVRSESGIGRAARRLRFPMIVKHPESYASIGLTRESRVEGPEGLAEQCRRMLQEYGGALVEEFIDGRELTALVAEEPGRPDRPHAYRPVEFVFPPGDSFKHYDLKWHDYKGMSCVPCDDFLGARVQEAARRFFLEVGGDSFGRCDFRLDASGELFALEINPNCGLFYAADEAASADFILLADRAGYPGFLRRVFATARARANRADRRRVSPLPAPASRRAAGRSERGRTGED